MPSSKKTIIVIAIGYDARDWPMYTRRPPSPHIVKEDLIGFLDDLVKKKLAKRVSGEVWDYHDKPRGLDFEIRVVYTKDEFRAALDIDNAIVVYFGHSRRGQGPAFGDSVPDKLKRECPSSATYPANPWENHFRMGYDVAMIPCGEDIFRHGTNPAEYSQKSPSKNFFASSAVRKALTEASGHSEACQQIGFARRTLLKCHKDIANLKNCRGTQSLKDRHYWREHEYKKERSNPPSPEFKKRELDTIVMAGSADLRAVKLRCKVLYMNSCSSRRHFYEALKRRKKETRSSCVFYLTRRTAYNVPTARIFLKQVLNGVDPATMRGSQIILKALNHSPEYPSRLAGRVVMMR